MRGDEIVEFAGKKAFEIAYAVYRISAHHKEKPIAESMERDAVLIVRSILGKDFQRAELKIRSLEYIARLGTELGIVNGNAGNMLIAELRGLQTAISKFESENEIDLKTIFKRQTATKEKAAAVAVRDSVPEGQTAIGRTVVSGNENDAKGNERQKAILNIIRQNGNCRLKDIQDGLAGVSERTVRYDLQRLVEGRVIERVGGGGPFSYYRLIGRGVWQAQSSSGGAPGEAAPREEIVSV